MTKWEDVLQKIINTPEFLSEINTKGFWKCDDSVIKYAKKNGVKLDSNAPNYVSLDFWSKQSEILKDNDYYILRSGGGTFVILDKKQFLNAYLDLSISDYTEMEIKEDPEFPELYKAFRKEPGDKSKQENSALEHPRALGCYDLLIKELFGNVRWYVGPRGGKTSKFKVYGKNLTEKQHSCLIIPVKKN